MLRSLLRLFISSIFLSIRRKVNVDSIVDNHVYEQTYDVIAMGVRYKVRISENIYLINYNCWFLPTLKRKIYKADLNYFVNDKLVKVYTEHYPKLTLGFGFDPLYPLVVVAHKHIDNFLTMEYKL